MLNPLGDQGNVLPAALLTSISGREYVGAHVVANLIIALSVGLIITALAAFFSPLPPLTAGAVGLASPVIIFFGSVVALSFGMAFPGTVA